MQPFSIVDCTLRDGGYYTNWDFPESLVETYFEAVRSLSISYVEVGYRSPPKSSYLGRFFYLGQSTLKACKARLRPDQGLAIMFNYKDMTPQIVDELTEDLPGLVDLIRFACPPEAIAECVELGRIIKSKGIKVAINVMYMTKYTGDVSPLKPLADAGDVVDYVALVDSHGGVMPHQVAGTFADAVEMLPQPIGFHGHDNLSLAFANSLEALRGGATMLDSTFTGMGRGAGNLKTELISIHREYVAPSGANFGKLAAAVDAFETLQREYGWGTNLAYMVSGAATLPQADVMDWLGTRRYQMDSIVEALRLQSDTALDDHNYPMLRDSDFTQKWGGGPAIVIGGGASIHEHAPGLIEFARHERAVLIHSSMRNATAFLGCNVPQIFCFAGQEYSRLDTEQLAALEQEQVAIATLPPPRFRDAVPTQGAVFQVSVQSDSSEKLGPVTDEPPLELAISVADALGASTLHIAGFDGYANATISQQSNAKDVQQAIDRARGRDFPWKGVVNSVTPTLYDIGTVSVYSQMQASFA